MHSVPKFNVNKHFLETGHEIHLENVKVLHCVYRGNLKCCYPAKVQLVVRLPPGRRGVLSPNHVTPIFFDILDLKDSEKFGMTFWAYSYLLENLKKVLKNHHFLEKLENLYSLIVLTKYY